MSVMDNVNANERASIRAYRHAHPDGMAHRTPLLDRIAARQSEAPARFCEYCGRETCPHPYLTRETGLTPR